MATATAGALAVARLSFHSEVAGEAVEHIRQAALAIYINGSVVTEPCGPPPSIRCQVILKTGFRVSA